MKKTLLFLITTITICSMAHAGGARFYAGGGGAGGDLLADGTVPLTADWDAGAWQIRAESFWADAGFGNGAYFLGDGGNYINEVSDTIIGVAVNGSPTWRMASTHIGSTNNYPAILYEVATATNPSVVAQLSDKDSGLVANGADTQGLTSGGVNWILGTESAGTVTITFPNGYTRHIQMPAGAAALGPSAPTPTTTGTARGFGCDADGEELFFNVEVPPGWNASSDMTAEIWWSSESGDAIADTEKVKWDVNYYSIADGEAVDNGTPVEITATYTQSGGGTDKEYFETEITVDYDHADQPLAADDTLFLVLNRDVTGEAGDSYSGLAIVYRVELKYVADKMPYQ